MSYSAEVAFFARKELGLLDDDFDEHDDGFNEPDVENYNSPDKFPLVGHGDVTNRFCGKFIGLTGCLRTDLHGLMKIDGKSYKNKIFRRVVHHYCCKPSCPVCWKSGFAVRAGHKIAGRLAEASKKFGLVEHICASVPVRDYGLPYEALRRKAKKVLVDRGIVGGTLIFHGKRFSMGKGWYFSPHWHFLGYILGGYDKCRRCTNKVCVGRDNSFVNCDGYEARTRRLRVEDGYIVKVLGKRKTIMGTAWYLLNHATYDSTKKRFHIYTWLGVCSYRKLKVTVEKYKELCPLCHSELIDIEYLGVKSLSSERNSIEDYLEDGLPAWGEKAKSYYGQR